MSCVSRVSKKSGERSLFGLGLSLWLKEDNYCIMYVCNVIDRGSKIEIE